MATCHIYTHKICSQLFHHIPVREQWMDEHILCSHECLTSLTVPSAVNNGTASIFCGYKYIYIYIYVCSPQNLFSVVYSPPQQYEDLTFNLLKSVIALCIDLNLKKNMHRSLARETGVLA
jgi:hypothetical protein